MELQDKSCLLFLAEISQFLNMCLTETLGIRFQFRQERLMFSRRVWLA